MDACGLSVLYKALPNARRWPNMACLPLMFMSVPTAPVPRSAGPWQLPRALAFDGLPLLVACARRACLRPLVPLLTVCDPLRQPSLVVMRPTTTNLPSNQSGMERPARRLAAPKASTVLNFMPVVSLAVLGAPRGRERRRARQASPSRTVALPPACLRRPSPVFQQRWAGAAAFP